MRAVAAVFPVPSLARFRVALTTVLLAFAFVAIHPLMARSAVKIQEVKSESGITAWLVEDYSVPIIATRFAFRGGSVQDPSGKDGLTYLMSGLFDEGAGDLEREAFQERLDDSGAEMSFDSSSDAFYGSMRVIADQADEGFALLAMAVQKPRFDAEPIDRIKAQILQGIAANSRDPSTLAGIAWDEAVYGSHPYGRRDEGTPETLTPLTRDDLVAQHRNLFARDNLIVGVVGAIDAETLKRRLDEVFAPLPEHATLAEVPQADIKFGQSLRVDYDLPQTTIRLAYPGLPRSDPAFFAAYLMNEVLGGGTFSSRLFEEVREKRGLAYGVGSSLVSQRYANTLSIGTSTRSDRADETLKIVLDEVKRMADEGPTQEELDAVKRYTVGAYAINNLDSSRGIAATLVELQLQELGIDYIERRESLIDAVTLDQVKAEAKKLLSAEPIVMRVGPKEGSAAANAPAPEPVAPQGEATDVPEEAPGSGG